MNTKKRLTQAILIATAAHNEATMKIGSPADGTHEKRINSFYSNDFNNSEVLNTLIPSFSNDFNLRSLDHKKAFSNDKHKATYGASLTCEDNKPFALSSDFSKKSLLTTLINSCKAENITSKSALEISNLEQISPLRPLISSNKKSGANSARLYSNASSKIILRETESFLKKEKMTLASTTMFILNSYLTIPYLLANASFTSLPRRKQSASVNLLSFAIRSNTETSNFLIAFDFSSFISANFSAIASEANLDLFSGIASISASSTSGIFMSPMPFTPIKTKRTSKYKLFGTKTGGLTAG